MVEEVAPVPKMYKASDGEQFSSKPDAERHQRLIDAQKAYMRAKSAYQEALWETKKTADGKAFKLDSWITYYYITRWVHSQPRLTEVRFYDCKLDTQNEEMIVYQTDEKSCESYRIGDLYADKAEAYKELYRRTLEWMEWGKERLAEVGELAWKGN